MSTEDGARRAPGQFHHRPDGLWQASLTDPAGQRHFYYGKTRAELKRRVEEGQKEILLHGRIGSGRQTVAEYLRWWLEDEVRPNRRATTYRGYQNYVEGHLIPALGGYRLDRLQPVHVQAFLAEEQRSGRATATVVQLRALLRRALGVALRLEKVTRNVAALTERPQGEKPELSPLTPEQAVTLLAAIRERREGPLYEVAMTTGLRLGELLGLRWSDVDLTRKVLTVAQQLQRLKGETVFVPPKTKAGRRRLHLPELTSAALRRERAHQAEERLALGEGWTDAGLVFTRPDGGPRNPTQVSHQFADLVDALGLPHQRFHDLRHLAASLLLAQGHSLKDVSTVMGHASIAITSDIYGHLYEEQRKEVADGMDAILRRHGVS